MITHKVKGVVRGGGGELGQNAVLIVSSCVTFTHFETFYRTEKSFFIEKLCHLKDGRVSKIDNRTWEAIDWHKLR